MWAWKLTKLLQETPLASSLREAVQSLAQVGIEVDDLEAGIDERRRAWTKPGKLAGLGLPVSYPIDFALAIYVYTLEDPKVYAVLNGSMFNNDRRKPGAVGGISDELQACMPFVKFLDAALAALPESFVFKGKVRRGVKWVYPSPDDHDPERHFEEDAELLWYEFKSTSERDEVMTRPHFCGVAAGPRTIFHITAKRAYSIKGMSFFQGAQSEHEVLFRPLSRFQVRLTAKNILDPTEKISLQKSGYPDAVHLTQVLD